MKKIYYGFLCLLLLQLPQCSQRSYLEISQTSFQEVVSTQENLKFTFNHSVVGDSLLNSWDTTDYISFTPKVDGKYKWISPYELVFSPSEGFAPSTDYEAAPGIQLNRQIPKDLNLKTDQVIKFRTQYLDLESWDMFWTQDERRTKQLRINLYFNYKVYPKSLQELISVKAEGEAIPALRILNSQASEVVELVIEEVGSLELDEKTLDFEIAPGVECAESDFITQKTIQFSEISPNKNRLRIESVSAEFEAESLYIAVKVNQTLSQDEILKNLSLRPAIPIEIELTDDGFNILGDFEMETVYTVTLAKDLQGIFGTNLREVFRQSVRFGQRDPEIAFAHKGNHYLSNKGAKNIGVRIINVPKVQVVVYKIFENNLTHFLRAFRYFDESDSYYYFDRSSLPNYGDVILDEEYDTRTLSQVQDFRVLNLNFDQLNSSEGIYFIEVNSTEDQWIRSSQFVSLSDIGLIARKSRDDVMVIANSLVNGQAMAGTQVQLISPSNQVLATATCNSEGIAQFEGLAQKYPDTEIPLIQARYQGDFNYLYLPTTGVETARFETQGFIPNESGYQAFLYSERDLYRPGETIPLQLVVRDREWNPVQEIPVRFRVYLPNGKTLHEFRGNLNKDGAYGTEFKVPASSITGTYTVEVFTSTDISIGTMKISLEEFIPDRIKVKINPVKADQETVYTGDYKAGDSARYQIEARNLFGPPAANRNYELSFYLSRKNFSAPALNGYTFRLNTAQAYDADIASEEQDGQTNKEGLIYSSFHIPKQLANQGLLSAQLYATVFDESGRSVSRQIETEVYTQNTFLGLKSLDLFARIRRAVQIPMAAVNKKGKPVKTSATAQVVRYRWQTVLERNGRDYSYRSVRKEEILKEEKINVDGLQSAYSYTPSESGDYELRLFLPNAKSYVSSRFYAYGNYGSNSSFEVNRDGEVDITLNQKQYRPGENAEILFTTPFDGRLIVTLERDNILEYRILNTQNKSAKMSLGIRPEFLPNVFVSATLIRPMSDGAIPLTVAHGYQSIRVDEPQRKIDLKIEAVAKSESQTQQLIKVKTDRPEAGINVTLAVVDEGILQMKNYQSPAPYAYFYQQRGLEVEPFDMYPQLFPEIHVGRLATGGGGLASAAGNEGSPLENKRIKLTHFWSGALKTNAAGEVSFPIDIPQFSGSLRIMAVAYEGNRFGSAEKMMTVADPIVISTGLPRFLSGLDMVKVPVTISNTTDKGSQARVKLITSQQLSIESGNERQVSIKAHREARVNFEIQAKQVIDSAKVSVVVSAQGREYRQDIDISILPVSGLLKRSGAGVVRAGTQQTLDLRHEFIPNTTEAKVLLSRSPLVRFTRSLEYLIRYPYGCVEQVTSSVFPQLFVQDLMRLHESPDQKPDWYDSRIRENVQEGILRLLSMQNYSGGLSYWPGGGQTSLFGTAYALHFMVEARKNGYFVNPDGMNEMMRYLKNRVKRKSTVDYRYRIRNNEDSPILAREVAPKELIYALYVLALAGEADVSTMNYYKENPKLLALDCKYLLASAYLQNGDARSYRSMLPERFSGEYSEQVLGGSFHSAARDEALVLNTLLEADPENVQIPELARHLSQVMSEKKYLNTQERSFGLMALGKFARKSRNSKVNGFVSRQGQNIASFIGNDLILSKNLAGQDLNIKAQGSGYLYYFWNISGLSAKTDIPNEDRRIRVRKTFYDVNGRAINDNTFRQNDLVVVKVTVLAEPYFYDLDNVVITDKLPAGLEIENPRLSKNRSLSWIEDQDYPDHMDIRDDRINYFTSATGDAKTFYYMARAVTQGTFQMGPVSAQAMYDESAYSNYGAGSIRILGRNESAN